MHLTTQEYLFNINHPWWGLELRRKSPIPSKEASMPLRLSSPEPVRRIQADKHPKSVHLSPDYKTVVLPSPTRSRIGPRCPFAGPPVRTLTLHPLVAQVAVRIEITG